MSTVYSYEKRVKLILVHLLRMINPRLLYSQEARWVEAEASASMADMSLQQARTSALNEARAEAVRIVAGVRIPAENFRIRTEIEVDKQVNEVRDFFSSMIRDVAFGQIIAEEIITEGPIPISIIHGKPSEFYYKVKIRAKVAIEKGEPDPSFMISVKTNKDIYQENE